jgi:hypothetical protein
VTNLLEEAINRDDDRAAKIKGFRIAPSHWASLGSPSQAKRRRRQAVRIEHPAKCQVSVRKTALSVCRAPLVRLLKNGPGLHLLQRCDAFFNGRKAAL